MEFKRGDRVFVEKSYRHSLSGTGTIVQFEGSIKDHNGWYNVAFDSFEYSDVDINEIPATDSDCHSINPEHIRYLTPLDELL